MSPMVNTRLTITLSEQERAALQKVAELEMRGLRDQARFHIRQALLDMGWLIKEDGGDDNTTLGITETSQHD